MINFRRIYMLIADFTTNARKPGFYKSLFYNYQISTWAESEFWEWGF
jgi:hypothetical protein